MSIRILRAGVQVHKFNIIINIIIFIIRILIINYYFASLAVALIMFGPGDPHFHIVYSVGIMHLCLGPCFSGC